MVTKAGFMGLPLRYENCWMDTFEKHPGVETAFAKCQEYVKGFTGHPRQGLYLHGMAGVGKTHLAVAVVNAVLNENPTYLGYALFTSVSELMFLHRKNKATNADWIVAQCIEAPLLVLDDLGSERANDEAKEVLYTIIDCRYQECLPTMITSTLDDSELEERYGTNFVSRIYGMCSPVQLSGPDHRSLNTESEWPSFGA